MKIASWLRIARATFSPGEPQDCAICGKYQSVAHAHHVYPLAWQLKDTGINLDDPSAYLMPDHDHVWLCPTHHALVHKELSDFRYRRYAEPMRVPLDEYKQIAKIVQACAEKMENPS